MAEKKKIKKVKSLSLYREDGKVIFKANYFPQEFSFFQKFFEKGEFKDGARATIITQCINSKFVYTGGKVIHYYGKKHKYQEIYEVMGAQGKFLSFEVGKYFYFYYKLRPGSERIIFTSKAVVKRIMFAKRTRGTKSKLELVDGAGT